MLSQSVTMPELDGGAVPFVLSALYRNKRGLLEFRTIPDRLERFAELVRKTTDLKRNPMPTRRSRSSTTAPSARRPRPGGLGVSQSILNVLRRLQQAGYTTGPLPETAEELNNEIEASNAAFGTNAGNAAAARAVPRVRPSTSRRPTIWRGSERACPPSLYETVTER